MLPPPAPRVTIFAAGVRTGRPWSRNGVCSYSKRPPEIRPTSKLVPPMSVVMMSALPRASPRKRAATSPPIGPELTIATASRLTCCDIVRPPDAVISWSG
jgi:hypothetical protein